MYSRFMVNFTSKFWEQPWDNNMPRITQIFPLHSGRIFERRCASEVTTSLRGGLTRRQTSRDGSGPRDAMSHGMATCWWPKQHAISSTRWRAHAMRLPRRDVRHRGSIATTSCSISRALACATTEKLLLVTHNVKLPDFRTSPT